MIRFTKAKHKLVRPVRKADQKSVLQKLNEYLEQNERETVQILYRNINQLQNVYTYKELREAYFAGQIPPDDFQRWQTEYARIIDVAFRARWELAAERAADEIKALHPEFVYEPSVSSAIEYIRRHGAELVTVLAQDQIDALNAIIGHISGYTGITPDEASLIMRPLIGLNRPQAIANANYLRKVKTKYMKDHPNAKIETADKVAHQAAARYGAKQHRYRAMMIARTELAFGYNAGHYGATLDAQRQGFIGECKKVWVTAYDERVCPVCSILDGDARRMDEIFPTGKQLPPAHPNCRCGVAYEEITSLDAPRTILHTEYSDGKIADEAMIYETNEVDNSEIVITNTPIKPVKTSYGCKDVTKEWLSNATPNSHEIKDITKFIQNGVLYEVDGKNVELAYSEQEKRIAELIERRLGGALFMIPKVNVPQHISTPDYLFRGERYDLKTLRNSKGKNAVYNRVNESQNQAENFILDITDNPLGLNEMLRQIKNIFISKHTRGTNCIIVIDNSDIAYVFERN